MAGKVDFNKYVGKKYNRLTVKSFYRDDNSNLMFICKCNCGNEIHSKYWHVTGGHTKSCGCLRKETSIKLARRMGKNTRKYEEKCTFCGKNEHFARGYCRNCYARYNKKGTVEYTEKELINKMTIPLTEEQIKKGLELVYMFEYMIIKNKLLDRATIWHYKQGHRVPKFTILKKCFDFFGIDIFDKLKIDDKYRDTKRYKV